MGSRELDRVRRIALALPEVNERLSHGAPCFFVGDKRPVCYYHDDHRADGRRSLWCPVPPGVQEELVSSEPERFFKPPMSARGTFSGWLGVFLDTSGENQVDWGEIAAILEEAFRYVAPKKLVAELGTSGPPADEERFWAIADPFLNRPGVSRSTMMGLPCLRINGQFFGSFDRRTGDLLVKLPEARVDELVAANRAHPFAPSGRRFREWAAVAPSRRRSWATLLAEALEFVADQPAAVRGS